MVSAQSACASFAASIRVSAELRREGRDLSVCYKQREDEVAIQAGLQYEINIPARLSALCFSFFFFYSVSFSVLTL